ncbi:uncharacterized protein G2W53_018113 [Senna tora]|uniref:Uncharacterized protein n=1 Tax=Senna tora TaxID=362788 RepID=A0A834TZX6_9FABA|nr:uncharacterized protein G2W53_018113 [Senna tora]
MEQIWSSNENKRKNEASKAQNGTQLTSSTIFENQQDGRVKKNGGTRQSGVFLA